MSIGLLLRDHSSRQRRLADRLEALVLRSGFEADRLYLPERWGRRAPNRLFYWARQHQAVVWLGSVLIRELAAVQMAKRRSVVLLDWPGPCRFEKNHVALRAVDHVVTASAQVARRLGSLLDRRVWHVPWDPGLPLTGRPPTPVTRSLVCTLLADGYYDAPQAVALLSHLLGRERPPVCLLGLLSGRVLPSLYRRLRPLLRAQALALLPGSQRPRLRAALVQSDLAVATGAGDGIGEAALEALASGCGVVGYDTPGLNELVQPGYNGRLVTTELVPFESGLLVARPDVDKLNDTVQGLLDAGRPVLAGLGANSGFGFAARRAAFERGWREVLGLDEADG